MSRPRLERVSGGWVARSERWTVYGATREEALRRFAAAARQRERFLGHARPDLARNDEPNDDVEAEPASDADE
jgi:hypothetical protein